MDRFLGKVEGSEERPVGGGGGGLGALVHLSSRSQASSTLASVSLVQSKRKGNLITGRDDDFAP